MGMLGEFKQVTPAELAAVIEDPSGLDELLYGKIDEQELKRRAEALKKAGVVFFRGSWLRLVWDVVKAIIKAKKKAASQDEEETTPEPEEPEDPSRLDIDKAWHGIHYLLTGTAWDTFQPLGDVILGGEELGEDMCYGPARYLEPMEVSNIAKELSKLSADDLKKRFNPADMEKLEIYPQIWAEDPESIDYLLHYYEKVRVFYMDAAAKGNAVFLWLH